MHSYSSTHGNMVGPCPCGLFHAPNQCSSSLSRVWPAAAAAASSIPNPSQHYYYHDDPSSHLYSNNYTTTATPPSTVVDCTLSLGTPSTRRSDTRQERRGCISNLCWDFLQPKQYYSTTTTTTTTTSSSSHNVNCTTPPTNPTHAADPLLARRCANCDTTSTPLWRNGPKGPKSLCNACGIRFKKEERRATAAAANPIGGGILESHVAGGYYNAWDHQPHAQHKVQYFSAPQPPPNSEFRFMDDVVSETGRDSDSGMFLSWRLNVTDRPTTLVHDFTR